MTVEKPKPKQLLRPITTGAGSAMNQSQYLAIRCNSLEAREKSRVHGAIGFGFASHWLKNWRESFKPITKRSKRNHVITFDSHLKTALQCKSNSHNLNSGRSELGSTLSQPITSIHVSKYQGWQFEDLRIHSTRTNNADTIQCSNLRSW